MTDVRAARTVLPPHAGGAFRRFVLVGLTVASWAGSLVFLGTVISPGPDEPTDWTVRAAELGLAFLFLALPELVFVWPARRRIQRQLSAVLAVAAEHPAPELPPFESWAGPSRMFRRLMVSSYSYTAIPLLLLVGSAIAFGLFLGEPGAGLVFGLLALIPMFFTAATIDLPRRLSQGVRNGLAAGQVVPLRVGGRIDQKMVMNDATMSWFDGVLPDGQHITLRTPRHFSWAGDARGAVDAPDLVLVMGRGAHQGLLLPPGRPEDAVWLLGPVPLVRVPRAVQRAFSEEPTS